MLNQINQNTYFNYWNGNRYRTTIGETYKWGSKNGCRNTINRKVSEKM